jgi:hypothetical protein
MAPMQFCRDVFGHSPHSGCKSAVGHRASRTARATLVDCDARPIFAPVMIFLRRMLAFDDMPSLRSATCFACGPNADATQRTTPRLPSLVVDQLPKHPIRCHWR